MEGSLNSIILVRLFFNTQCSVELFRGDSDFRRGVFFIRVIDDIKVS